MLKVEMIGILGADAEVRESNGSKFVVMRVADSRKVKSNNGDDRSIANWIDVTFSRIDSPVFPFLRQGVKIFVRGSGSLRVYSSPKDHCMKAGLTIHAQEIELCGGQYDEVPKQLIVPESGMLVDITKHYWANYDTKGMKKNESRALVDAKGRQYVMDAGGFVHVVEDLFEHKDDQSQD